MSPLLAAWAEQGYESLAEITRAQVSWPCFPPSGSPGRTAGAGLRSLFSVLKARKVVFSQPHRAASAIGEKPSNIPLPVDTAAIRGGAQLARARAGTRRCPGRLPRTDRRHVRAILLTDVHDGRLTVDDREHPLGRPRAGPADRLLGRPSPPVPADRSTPTCWSTGDPPRARHRSPRDTPGTDTTCSPARCARTASCTRSTPPEATSAESATCSGSASTPPCATRPCSSTPTSPPTATGVREPQVRDRLTTTPEPLGSPPRNLQNS